MLSKIRELTKPKIIYKGLGLILIPAVFNAFWLILLKDSSDRAFGLTQRMKTQSALLQCLHQSYLQFGIGMTDLTSYALFGRPRFRTQAENHFRQTLVILDQIDQLTAGDATMQDWIKQAKASLTEELDIVIKVQVPRMHDDMSDSHFYELVARMRNLDRFHQISGHVRDNFIEMIDQKQKLTDTLREDEFALQARLKHLADIGIALNMLFAIVLAVVFIRDITGRLDVLVDNTRRLPRLQPLNEPIGGNDELSSLDATMHAAFDQLKEATEYRKSLMEMMAHDLRTPLAACQISIEMLDTIDGAKLSPMGQKQLHSIKVNVSRQLNLIKELLLLESLESGTMELDVQMADLAKVAQNAIDTVQALATAKDISLVNAITASGIEGVPCDPERISQVFTNYLSNAIKLSPRNATIKIRARLERISQDDADEPDDTADDAGENTERGGDGREWLVVSVEDEGPGFGHNEGARLFQKFYQAKEGKKAGGTGLGLAICKLIVESHGGRVGAENIVRHDMGAKSVVGARFWFALKI